MAAAELGMSSVPSKVAVAVIPRIWRNERRSIGMDGSMPGRDPFGKCA